MLDLHALLVRGRRLFTCYSITRGGQGRTSDGDVEDSQYSNTFRRGIGQMYEPLPSDIVTDEIDREETKKKTADTESS